MHFENKIIYPWWSDTPKSLTVFTGDILYLYWCQLALCKFSMVSLSGLFPWNRCTNLLHLFQLSPLCDLFHSYKVNEIHLLAPEYNLEMQTTCFPVGGAVCFRVLLYVIKGINQRRNICRLCVLTQVLSVIWKPCKFDNSQNVFLKLQYLNSVWINI